MNLWRLELLRLVRTHRWMIVVGVYVLFGVTGPLTARYLDQIIERFGGGVVVEVPETGPVDGIAQFVSNASQLGVLAVVVVAAAALALDARPEAASFLRTRTERPGLLLLPRYTASAAVAVVALVLGTAAAWGLAGTLLGPVPGGPLMLGTALGALYLVFAVSVVAAISGAARSIVTIVFASLAVLVMLPVLGVVDVVRPWLPSELLGAVTRLVAGESAGSFLRATVTAILLTALLVGAGAMGVTRREL